MSNKKRFVLRIDEETMKALEKWSNEEFRSLNGQIEFLLTKSLKSAKRLSTTKKKATK